jgi:predicted P-loop ATPase
VTSSAADIALAYRRRGWFPIPIPHKSKIPQGNGWNKLRLDETEIPKRFDGQWNIGVLTGSVSNNLTDIDLDCNAAVRLAPHFLPPTESRFGRPGRPLSHWLYNVYGACTEVFASPKKINGQKVDSTTFVELRFDGKQTVFPGSTHESGELIEWVDGAVDAAPAVIKAEDLRQAVARLASACVLVQYRWSDDDAVGWVMRPDLAATQKLPPEVREALGRWLGLHTEQKAHKPVVPSTPFETAVRSWNESHPLHFEKRNTGPCPVCKDHKSFGQCKDNPHMWSCFSTDHPDNVGIRSPNGDCFIGDALDLHCYEVGKTRQRVLVEAGLLEAPRVVSLRREDRPAGDNNHSQLTDGATALNKQTLSRPWRSRSYLTAVDIIGQNARDVLQKRKLEFNEMSGNVELARQPIKDTDISRVRANIEACFMGGMTKDGDEIGLQINKTDIQDAIAQVAADNRYHPVQDYLNKSVWDGERRIHLVPKMILGADDSPINSLLVRKFFLSSVARPMKPGCKCDTVFILVGAQGARKSSLFDVLSSPWFIDTPIDIGGDLVRAYMTMRQAWLLEWSELEPLLRSRRHETVRGFLSSRKDDYIPKFGHYSVTVERSGVIVGSTNSDEFLNDETGERRYWPIHVGRINLDLAIKWKDQLWAEAVTLYRSGEPWWLADTEEQSVTPTRSRYVIRDVWAEPLLSWAPTFGRPFTTTEALMFGIGMKLESCTRAEEMRVAKIFKTSGWERRTDSDNKSTKKWFPPGSGRPTGV